MRRALALLAAVLPLALAACSVDVEGAPCTTPGTTTDCPSGQACGNGGTCSERAASCATPESRCTPGVSRCAGVAATERAETCTDADPVCGTWTVTDCASRGLVCGTRSPGSEAACECRTDFEGPEFAADPVEGSPSGAAPFPTGAASPPECRFRSLRDAVPRAGQLAGPAAVQVHGALGAQVVFDNGSGDGLVIPATVTVIAAPAPAGPTVLRGAAAGSQALVGLQGRLEGFRIERTGGDGPAVATSCGAQGKPSLSGVVVDGGGSMTTGVDVWGACGADLTGVDVSRVAGPALLVHSGASAEVKVYAGKLRDSTVGASVTGGKVTFGSEGDPLGSVEVTGNTREGVVGAAGAATDVRLYDAKIHGNGGTGFVVDRVSAGSAITLRGCDVHSNGGAVGAPRKYGPGTQRTAGGVLAVQGTLPFSFSSNRVYGNAGDQLAFESSSSAWSIAPVECGASSNLFTCVAPGAYAIGIAGGGQVDARNTVWPEVPFQDWVSDGVTGSYCNGLAGVPATPACAVLPLP
jgi:hypothetical protein